MAFQTTDQILDQVIEILRERMEKRKKELVPYEPSKTKAVVKWLRDEWDWPAGNARGDLPKGVVSLDQRDSERREQDSGETATLDITISIYFSEAAKKAKARRWATAYGDGILYTLMMESLGKRPKDATVIPGLFRIWPTSMRPGETEQHGLYGAEVKARVTVDSSFSAAE